MNPRRPVRVSSPVARSGSLLVLLAAFVLTASARAEEPSEPAEPAEPRQAPERFLRDWVRGEAGYDLYPFFHEHASDVHREDSEHFEVAVKVLALRTKGSDEVRSALVGELLETARADDTPEVVGLRALHVLGRLAASEALPLLVEDSRSAAPERRAIAIRGLGFYGVLPSEEGFSVYGGRIRYVVQPAAPHATATRALLEAFDAARTTSPAGLGYGRGPFRRAGPTVSLALRDAVAAHPSAETAKAVAALLRDPGSLSSWGYGNDIATLLARCVPSAGLGILLELAREEDEETRRLAARALGRSARREAVPPLLVLLDDSSAAARMAAHLALTRLAGRDEAPADASRAAWTKRFGEDGERFDPAQAKKLRQLEPGIYKLGS